MTMMGRTNQWPASGDARSGVASHAESPVNISSMAGFHAPGPLGLADISPESPACRLLPAARHGRVLPAASAPEFTLTFGSRALHPSLTAHSQRVLRDLLRTAGIRGAHIISTSRSLTDDARVAFLYFEKQDFEGNQRQEAMKDPLAAAYLKADDDDEAPAAIVETLESQLSQLGPAYTGRYRRAGSLLDVVNIDPDSITAPEAFIKAVTRDPRVDNFLHPPLSPHFHLEIPQPRSAGSGKDGSSSSASDAAPPPSKTKAKTWIEFRVLEDGTGNPVGGVRLRITTPDGVENFYTADSAGLVRIPDLDPGQCDIGEMIDADALEVVSVQ
jgi:hypothetical protein